MPVDNPLVWPLYQSGDQPPQDIYQHVQQEVLVKDGEEDFSTI